MTYNEEVGFHRLQHRIIMSPVANCILISFAWKILLDYTEITQT